MAVIVPLIGLKEVFRTSIGINSIGLAEVIGMSDRAAGTRVST